MRVVPFDTFVEHLKPQKDGKFFFTTHYGATFSLDVKSKEMQEL